MEHVEITWHSRRPPETRGRLRLTAGVSLPPPRFRSAGRKKTDAHLCSQPCFFFFFPLARRPNFQLALRMARRCSGNEMEAGEEQARSEVAASSPLLTIPISSRSPSGSSISISRPQPELALNQCNYQRWDGTLSPRHETSLYVLTPPREFQANPGQEFFPQFSSILDTLLFCIIYPLFFLPFYHGCSSCYPRTVLIPGSSRQRRGFFFSKALNQNVGTLVIVLINLATLRFCILSFFLLCPSGKRPLQPENVPHRLGKSFFRILTQTLTPQSLLAEPQRTFAFNKDQCCSIQAVNNRGRVNTNSLFNIFYPQNS